MGRNSELSLSASVQEGICIVDHTRDDVSFANIPLTAQKQKFSLCLELEAKLYMEEGNITIVERL